VSKTFPSDTLHFTSTTLRQAQDKAQYKRQAQYKRRAQDKPGDEEGGDQAQV